MAEPKRIYVVRWNPTTTNGEPSPVYAAGSGADAKRPSAKTGAKKSADYRKRIHKDPHARDVYLAKKRSKARGRPLVDPLVAAFFGMV